MITRDLAVCTYYGQTSKGYYQGNPEADEAYYLAARMANHYRPRTQRRFYLRGRSADGRDHRREHRCVQPVRR